MKLSLPPKLVKKKQLLIKWEICVRLGAFLHFTTFDYGGAIHCLDSKDTSNHRGVLKNNYHAMMFVPVLSGYLVVRMLYISDRTGVWIIV
jgi:hypothetical protein